MDSRDRGRCRRRRAGSGSAPPRGGVPPARGQGGRRANGRSGAGGRGPAPRSARRASRPCPANAASPSRDPSARGRADRSRRHDDPWRTAGDYIARSAGRPKTHGRTGQEGDRAIPDEGRRQRRRRSASAPASCDQRYGPPLVVLRRDADARRQLWAKTQRPQCASASSPLQASARLAAVRGPDRKNAALITDIWRADRVVPLAAALEVLL